MKNRLKSAYTLSEVIIVVLIIAVLVSISIKTAKTKLNNITSYTYYSAYNTIRAVSVEMLKDFDAEEEEYSVALNNDTLFSKVKYFANSLLATNPVFAVVLPPGGTLPGSGSSDNYYEYGSTEGGNYTPPVIPETSDSSLKDKSQGSSGNYSTGGGGISGGADFEDQNCATDTATCPNGYKMNTVTCKCEKTSGSDSTPDSGAGSTSGSEQTSDPDSTPEPIANPILPPTPTPDVGVVDQIDGCPAFISRECEHGKVWNEERCGCDPTPRTVARRGAGFCRLFASYANTADEECQGDAISSEETDFADKAPDMILRNGMRLYNVSQDPQPIELLNGNSKGVTYIDFQNREVDVDTWGYTLYIDVDGQRSGNGRLWEDVYPFYVTLSGTVIPAYDIDNPETAGADSRLHLQTSVYDEFVDENGRHTQWITKSTTFKESACTMGYISASSSYCTTAPAVASNEQCSQDNHDCRLKTIMPIKFFGR